MPPIRSVQFSSTQIVLKDYLSTKTLLVSLIPSAQNTISKVESWINNTWIPANIVGYQAQVHIFSIIPFSVSVWTGNIGETIPSNWWIV